MPRITNIHVMRRTNLGNYEHFEFSADAVISEEENLAESTTAIQDYVDWHARKPVRDALRAEHLKTVAKEDATEEAKAKAQRWLDKYDAMKSKVEDM